MAAATLLGLPCRFKSPSITARSSSSTQLYAAHAFRSLSFSAGNSLNLFSTAVAPKKKVDSAVKRARQAEKRRMYNRARKSEVRTRMKKVLEKLDVLKKKKDTQPDEVDGIEKLIAERPTLQLIKRYGKESYTGTPELGGSPGLLEEKNQL